MNQLFLINVAIITYTTRINITDTLSLQVERARIFVRNSIFKSKPSYIMQASVQWRIIFGTDMNLQVLHERIS
jgi:hypothetical protein